MSWTCRLEGLSARWGDGEFVLRDVELELDCERLRALPLMGPSGAGKSTLLFVMASLKWPASGTVTWTFPDGDVVTWGPRGLDDETASRLRRKLFGFSFQDSTLSGHLTVAENLAYPLSHTGLSAQDVEHRVKTTLQAILLERQHELVAELLDRFPHQLSGGQRQRAALAQAWIHDPRVLFADEPAGNLDLATRRQVMEVLKGWLDEHPRQRFLAWVTHHTDDPLLMGTDELVWVDAGGAAIRTRSWLDEWSRATLEET